MVAFFATGDSIVGNNVVLNLYRHINAPEARMYLSRQIYEEALHVQFYLTLLDTYLPDAEARAEAFSAVDNIPSIRAKADFCFRWMDSISDLDALRTIDERRQFVLNLICFAACVEGMFFFAAFAYVYFLRSKGMLHGLAAGTNWVFRDESLHMEFAFSVIDTVRQEEPELFDAKLEQADPNDVGRSHRLRSRFCQRSAGEGITGLSEASVRQYLEYVADARLGRLGFAPQYKTSNPFDFLDLQDVQEVTNFFERQVSAYQVGIVGAVALDIAFQVVHLNRFPGFGDNTLHLRSHSVSKMMLAWWNGRACVPSL